MPPQLDAFISCESAASRIEGYVPTVVPGILQTADYAEEVFRRLAPNLTPAQIRQQVDLRMARQRALAEREVAPDILLIAPETVLRRLVGREQTMRDQLTRLTAAYDDAGVDFRVIPFRAGIRPAMEGGFTVFHFPDTRDADVVALETVSSTHFVDQEENVRKHQLVLEDMQKYVLGRPESLEFIERLRDDDNTWRSA